jgi:sugar lactone lactonase YvrE
MRSLALLFLGVAIALPVQADQDLLVGSWATHSIRRYSLDGTFLGDFVPAASGGLNTPDGMDWGPDGDLWVSSSGTNSVLRFDGESGDFLGAFATGLAGPGNLKFGPDGMLYVCNKNLGQVVRFDPAAGPSSKEVFATGGGLQNPVGLLWVDALLYVSDFSGRAIRKFDAETGVSAGNFVTQNSPLILNLDKVGNLLVSTHTGDSVRRFNLTTGAVMPNFTVGGPIDCPVGHLFAPDGQMIVASWQNHRLLRYDGDTGAYIGPFASGSGLQLPNDLLLTPVPEPSAIAGAVSAIAIATIRRRGSTKRRR